MSETSCPAVCVQGLPGDGWGRQGHGGALRDVNNFLSLFDGRLQGDSRQGWRWLSGRRSLRHSFHVLISSRCLSLRDVVPGSTFLMYQIWVFHDCLRRITLHTYLLITEVFAQKMNSSLQINFELRDMNKECFSSALETIVKVKCYQQKVIVLRMNT